MTVIPLILIAISFLVIFIIIARKFSALASLDIETMPAEKEARFKEQLVESRLSRGFAKWTAGITGIFRAISNRLSKAFSYLNDKLNEMKKDHDGHMNDTLSSNEKAEKLEKLFLSIEDKDDKEDFSEVEKALIEAIGLDSKNIKAFEKLGDLYYENKKFEEAKQAFEHILKLLSDEEIEKQAEIHFDLALVFKDSGQEEAALEAIGKAVKLSPNNPRFLDAMLEIGIMNKDRSLAEEVFTRLAEVDPENNKLEELAGKIKEL
ncbi:hypothetical protein GF382_02255 [Candidatus Falkowbacteria bacterium]|nr:hypothetical protein [Candidatus Falkowbacteria bacterium]